MFAQHIQVECVSFFEPDKGEWHQEAVEKPTDATAAARQESDEDAFVAFCRRSLA